MRAVTWQAKRDVGVDDVPDPTIEEPTDAIIRVASSGICGSDLQEKADGTVKVLLQP